MSSVNRITGMVSGFDTESMVKKLMKIEQTKTDKVLREKQSVNWQKDAYKEMMSLFRGFQSDFLDVLKPGSNMRSEAAFNSLSSSAKINGTDTAKIAVSTSSSSSQGTIVLNKIKQLATKDTWTSDSNGKSLDGTSIDLSQLNDVLASGAKTFSITLDGTTKDIQLSGTSPATSYASVDALVSDMNTKIASIFGTTAGVGRIVASNEGGALKLSSTGHTVALGEKDTGFLNKLGFASGASNEVSMTDSLATAFNVSDSTLAFSINGVSSTTMGITAADSIQTMVQKINRSGAGVTMSYSNLTNGFSMRANKEGFANNITLEDSNNFFSSKLNLSSTNGRTQGVDAEFIINGVETSRSENRVVIDGTTIQLKELSDSAIDITLTPNNTTTKENIIKFVGRYNEMIEKVYGKIDEKKYRDYTPLTDEEKADMSEDNIKLWESKAKSGLLKGDSILAGMMEQLRSAFGDSVPGVGITLMEMGITTSSDYSQNGKLIIDESKLEDVLANRSAEVTAFFTKESDFSYGDSANAKTRYSENGLAARVNDILNNNIRLTRDNNGLKGALVEKAGYEKGSSDLTSDLAKKLTELETRYATLVEKMNDTEDRYYAKFTAMETALSKMNTQSSSLNSMFSSSS